MPELLEPFTMGIVHSPDDPKCPFCPKKTNDEHYTTYGGADNKGTTLGKLIDEPGKFGKGVEADARPKNGAVGKDGRRNQAFIDNSGESLSDVKGSDTEWTFQAHHAICGNQCLKGDAVEDFIKASGKIRYDTGYSVNNPQNGVWLPSSPDSGVAWPGKDKPAKRFALARQAMDKFKRQFHLGHHDIAVDVDGLDPKTDEKYVDYVKKNLKALHSVLLVWEAHCPETDGGTKHLGNPRIHAALDHVSEHIIKKLKGTPDHWTTFISRHARDYTIKVRNPNSKLDFER